MVSCVVKATKLVNKSQIEYSAGMFVSRQRPKQLIIHSLSLQFTKFRL